ncbi:unnamed protein product, partial [Bubo scandiacus]
MALPRTLGELQLYRVLQRANLLGYYETFIQQGGDDVQQLCEAGEEEFLEIMALVGMATKPLHVRRLQKALREWASNPGLFSQPVSAVPVSSIPLFKLSEAGGRKALSNGHASPGEAAGKGGGSSGTPPARSPTEPGEKLSPSAAPPWPGRSTPESEGGGDEEPGGPPFSPGGSGGEQPTGTEVLEPELARTVAESVERLLQSCPRGGEAELRALMKLNKKLAKAVGHIFQLEDGDRHKEEEIRRHSAIYGRGEARRREGKQLTLHELIINEAARPVLPAGQLAAAAARRALLALAAGRPGEHLPVLAQGRQGPSRGERSPRGQAAEAGGGGAESPRAAGAAGGAGAPRGRVPSQPGGGRSQPVRGEPRRPLAGGGGLSPPDAAARCGPRGAPRPPPPRALEPPHPAADADGRGAAPGPAGVARARGAAQPLPAGEAPGTRVRGRDGRAGSLRVPRSPPRGNHQGGAGDQPAV